MPGACGGEVQKKTKEEESTVRSSMKWDSTS